jgi:hypothetical protein
MNIDNKKVEVGRNVKITQKNGENSSGAVRRILRKSKEGAIVELINGSMGRVVELIPRRAKVYGNRELKRTVLKSIIKRNEVSEKDLLAGESKSIEHKQSALWSQDLRREELEKMNTPEVRKYGNRASKIIIAKVITGFLNTSGGDLIIGIKEEKEQQKNNTIEGIDRELKQLKNKDYGEDGYKRMIMDDIIRPHLPKTIFNHFNDYFSITFFKKERKILCRINVKKSNSEVFLTIGNNDYFFIRADTQTRELRGKDIIDYIRRHFK